MSLNRYEGSGTRGPTAELWAGIADWPHGVNSIDLGSGRIDDHTPFLGDDVGRTSTGDGAVLQTDEPHGVVNYDEAQGTDEVTGFQYEQVVDLDRTGFKAFAIESRVKSNDDNATTETFVGLTDVAIGSFWGADNTPDGSSIGVLWDGDETFDIVSVASDDTLTVLKAAFATVARTEGFVKIGFKIENLDGTNYRCTGTVTSGSGSTAVTKRGVVTSSTIPGAAMKPAVLHTNDNEAAPDFEEDWTAYVDLS